METNEGRTGHGDPAQRAGDADRDRVTTLLSQAAALGYLSVPEFEERSGQALQARTVGELVPLLADLPVSQMVTGTERSERRAAARAEARTGLRIHLSAYVGSVILMVALWLIIGLTTGSWYFWPVWPALGWGIGVASHAVPVLTGRASGHGCGSRLQLATRHSTAG